MIGNKELHSELIDRCIKGDIKAQYKLFTSYSVAMYNTAMRFFANQMDAEDVVQESFITAFKKMKSFRGDSTFGKWLKSIVINKSISELRKRKIEFDQIDEHTDKLADIEIRENFNPEKVHEFIKLLPAGARTIINLFAFENYSHEEIAEKLKISVSTSKTQYMRAKKLLFEKIKPLYSNEI